MRWLSTGVFRMGDSHQLEAEPRLVAVGYWDLPRSPLAMATPLFGERAWDELIARLIGLSQLNATWVAVGWAGFERQIKEERSRPAWSAEYLGRHLQGDMPEPDLIHAPVYSLTHRQLGLDLLERGFETLAATRWVRAHQQQSSTQLSLSSAALQHIRRARP